MVNHYASLLLNLPGENRQPENKSYFTEHSYSPALLPGALRDFHHLLFPQNSSFYYKQFLCYCFLRVLLSAKQQEVITSYDRRITYDLDSLNEYFRLTRTSIPIGSNPAFNLLVLGKYQTTAENNYYYNAYSVLQNSNLPEVFVYSVVDKIFYKNSKISSAKSPEMSIPLVYAGNNLTKPVSVGDTGLSFVLTGNFNNPLSDDKFTDTSDKYWNFIVESPFTFEFINFYKNLMLKDVLVARMINYGENKNPSYLNLWNNHFNEAYKFSGLLNLYIEKVHELWAKNQT